MLFLEVLIFIFLTAMLIFYFLPYRSVKGSIKDKLSLKDKKLILCYVSKGTNVETLKKSISASKNNLTKLAESFCINTEFELVIDNDIVFDKNFDFIKKIVVPSEFKTLNGTLFKARSLEYARQQRDKADCTNTWILHLDEESVVCESGFIGVLEFVSADCYRIGQGEIVYDQNSNKKSPSQIFIQSADILRVMIDRTASKAFYWIFGRVARVLGSFFLIRQDLENKIKLDFSSKQSVAEDIAISERLYAINEKIGWVKGNVSEQSATTLKDFFTQRSRWQSQAFINPRSAETFSALMLLFAYFCGVLLVLRALLLAFLGSLSFYAFFSIVVFIFLVYISWLSSVKNQSAKYYIVAFISSISLSCFFLEFLAYAKGSLIKRTNQTFLVVKKD